MALTESLSVWQWCGFTTASKNPHYHGQPPRLSRYEASPANTFSRYEASHPALSRLVSMPT
ncbi:MAG: hypothetical protein VSS75_021975 [Candidatus Parabeggiatoa sp.]|nr:hypothetical protein [Candidatus Parabeggiatoa sp.]